MEVFKGRKYKSKLESLVGSLLGPTWLYEPFKVHYVTYRNYSPDFVYQVTGVHQILVEVKGFFRVGDTQKYKAIKASLDREDMREGPRRELVFFLQSPKTKVRKGGKLTMAQWCDKEGFPWFASVADLLDYSKGLT